MGCARWSPYWILGEQNQNLKKSHEFCVYGQFKLFEKRFKHKNWVRTCCPPTICSHHRQHICQFPAAFGMNKHLDSRVWHRFRSSISSALLHPMFDIIEGFLNSTMEMQCSEINFWCHSWFASQRNIVYHMVCHEPCLWHHTRRWCHGHPCSSCWWWCETVPAKLFQNHFSKTCKNAKLWQNLHAVAGIGPAQPCPKSVVSRFWNPGPKSGSWNPPRWYWCSSLCMCRLRNGEEDKIFQHQSHLRGSAADTANIPMFCRRDRHDHRDLWDCDQSAKVWISNRTQESFPLQSGFWHGLLPRCKENAQNNCCMIFAPQIQSMNMFILHMQNSRIFWMWMVRFQISWIIFLRVGSDRKTPPILNMGVRCFKSQSSFCEDGQNYHT